jgi:hypothetical protein
MDGLRKMYLTPHGMWRKTSLWEAVDLGIFYKALLNKDL